MTTVEERLGDIVIERPWTQTVEAAYHRRSRQLWEYGQRLGLDAGSAEEAMQDVFVRVLHLSRARRPDNLDAWLFRSLYNYSMDRHRQVQRVRVLDIGEPNLQLHRGHPDTDTYSAPPFAAVLARPVVRGRGPVRSWFAPRAVAAVVTIALAGLALIALARSNGQVGGFVPASPPALTQLPALTAGGLLASDRHAIASLAGVADAAVLAIDGGAVATRWRNGRVELLWATGRPDWSISVLSSVEAPKAAGGVSAAIDMTTCAGTAARPSFVYGMFIDLGETTLAIHSVDGLGGDISDGTFVFAVAAHPGASFWIGGPKDPGAPSPWPTASGVSEPAHPGAYFVGTIAAPIACPGF